MSQNLSNCLDTFKSSARECPHRTPVFLVVTRSARYAYGLHDHLHGDRSSSTYFEKYQVSIKCVDPITAGALLGHYLGSLGVQVAPAIPLCPFKGFTAIAFEPDQIAYATYRTNPHVTQFAGGEVEIAHHEELPVSTKQGERSQQERPPDTESVIARLFAERMLVDTGLGPEAEQGNLAGRLVWLMDRPDIVAKAAAHLKKHHRGREKALFHVLDGRPELADLAWQVKLELSGG